jgi:serine phosphatase RsbU (regulator of sigma subunit)
VQLLRKGCNDYIDKPFVKQDLLNRIDAVFKTVEDDLNKEKLNSDHQYRERADLHREIETYRTNYENLRTQMDSALTAYHELIHPYQKDIRIPVCIRSAPLSELGGDYFDIRDTETGCVIFIADVAGHDMGASYHTILIKALLDEYHRKTMDGLSLFSRLNRRLIENSKEERMVTAVFFSLNLKTMQGEIISAAHPPVICMPPGKTPLTLSEHQNTVLGVFEDISYKKDTFQIHPGDRFFLYTDGLVNISMIDAATGNRRLLNESGLIALLEHYRNASIHDMIRTIWQDIHRYKFNDDILLSGLEIPEQSGD